jgi:pseudouridine-5'-phosphate glycosidase
MTLNPYLDIAPEVQHALQSGVPVVALESTIISHGMPYPQNVQTALMVEAEVRAHGAVPATIAIVNGRLKAGLSEADIEQLGRSGRDVVKVSRRDVPFIVAAGATGATTVASTMIISAMAGIRVFATGGIGGVHRGAQESFDVSADLQELARTPVSVVCAGAKSILDLRLTLEYLETHGVPVVGYQTSALPAFFTRDSAFNVDYRLDTPAEIAGVLHAKWSMGLDGGMVIANPIPPEFAMPRDAIDAAIEQALAEAKAQGVGGKESTPFLLARVCELTGGDSLVSNIQLVLNNARLASAIGKSLLEAGGKAV